MENNKFFVLVGATGSGKNTMLEMLEQHSMSVPSHGVPCDSKTSVSGVTTSFIRVDTNCMRQLPIARLLKIWSRISEQIQGEVKPALSRGDRVVMNGFGGSAFAEAAVRASSEQEHAAILDMHKSCIEHCVIAAGVKPPVYIWLRVTPEVALRRRRSEKTLPSVTDPLRYVQQLNEQFDFYRTLPGQTVIPVDADRSIDKVFADVLSIIESFDNFAEAA